jgi:hypothetical protein
VSHPCLTDRVSCSTVGCKSLYAWNSRAVALDPSTWPVDCWSLLEMMAWKVFMANCLSGWEAGIRAERGESRAKPEDGPSSHDRMRMREWLGGRESLPRLSEIPINTGVFRLTRTVPAIWHFRILSSAFVRSPQFSDFAGAMTLEMTLAPVTS